MAILKSLTGTKPVSLALLLCMLNCPIGTMAQHSAHPRIYVTNESKAALQTSLETTPWKKDLVEKKKERLGKYIKLWEDNPEWLVSRLQMNWKTKHNKVLLKGGEFSHSEGEAPVATVRFSVTRDWATEYKRPKLEEVEYRVN